MLLAWTVVLAFALSGAPATFATSVDLAQKKPAMQRDISSGGLPSRGVDGNNDNNYSHNHCTHTSNANDNSKNWWAVDLGQLSTIEKVKVYNRGDCCGNRLANFDIVVTNNKPTVGKTLVYTKAEVCYHKSGAVRQGGSETLVCKATGRYVAIAQTRKQPLTLCGVQVYGHAGGAPATPATVELARKKPAMQRDISSGGLPSRGVDGNNDNNYSHNHCTHTLSASDNSKNWWAVDLGQLSTIQKVKVYNRGDCCGYRLANFDIVVTNKRPTVGKTLAYTNAEVCHHRTGAVKQGGSESYACKGTGRYVAIAQTRKLPLTLCGVDVYGYNGGAHSDADCSPGFKLDDKNNCVDRCPKFEEKWFGKKCVVRCLPSQKWDGKRCVSKCKAPHKYNTAFGSCETRTCRCRASGDPHYYQYDGTRIDFMGKCKYTYTKLKDAGKRTKCYFNVEEKNVHLGNARVSYVKLVDVDIEEMSFRYNDQTRKVYVNGIDRTRSRFPINLSTKQGTKIVVSYSNRRFSVQAAECSFTTTYRNYYMETYISSAIGSKVEGMCGTCNGDRRDDLIPRGKKRGSDKNTFSNSWSIPDDSQLQPQSTCISAEVKGECTVAWGKKVKDNNHCGYFSDKNGPFKSCIASGLVDVEQFKDSCEFDACFYSKGKSPNTRNIDPQIRDVVCKNMAAFADACGKQGVGAVWRRTDFCPEKCEANAYYSPKMYPVCEKTCQQRSAPKGCTNGQPEDGCTCKNGFFRLGNDCVPPAQCGCDAPDGQHLDSGKTVVTSDCAFKYECSAQGQLKKTNFPACHKDAGCAPVNGHFACKCNAGFTGNGHACQSKCKSEEKWDVGKSSCILYCPNQATRWDGKACVPRCPDVQTRWNGRTCEKRCPNPATQWSTVRSACQPRCPDVNTKWDVQKGKCVDRCVGHKYWDQTASKCTDRCADADKWDAASSSCKPRCPNHQEWKGKCVNRCQIGQKWHEPTKKCYQDPMYPKTERGNADGAGCAIPFLYNKKWQEDCVRGDNKKWCGTTENFDKDGKWGYCPVSCRTKAGLIKYPGDAWMDGTQKVFCNSDGSVGQVTGDFSTTTGGTAGGAGCFFPFYYSGSYRGDCVDAKPWCYTNKDGSKWGYCPAQCKLSGGGKKTAGDSWRQGGKKAFCDENADIVEIEEETVKTKGGKVCTFPFKYGGKYYGECADPAKPWCALTSDYDANTSAWDWCRGSCRTQDNKKVDPGATWTHGGTVYSCGKDGKVRKNVKTSAGNCLFPFHYQSVAYEQCTEAASAGKPWCYTDEAEKTFGYC